MFNIHEASHIVGVGIKYTLGDGIIAGNDSLIVSRKAADKYVDICVKINPYVTKGVSRD